MSQRHPIHYIVKAQRNNIVMSMQEATDRDAAQQLKDRCEAVPGTTAEIIEVHEPTETDLTTHTRELVEDVAEEAKTAP